MAPGLMEWIASRYRVATDAEIRVESYGVLQAARIGEHGDWRERRGTFDDQAIFGPRVDFRCACGKYVGSQWRFMVCDICGVKVTTSDSRQSRCAHIQLPTAIIHPLVGEDVKLTVLPVLPVAFIEAAAGARLLAAYDAVLQASDTSAIVQGFQQVLDVLAPPLVTLHDWNLQPRLLIAHGMGLIDKGTEGRLA